MSKLKNKVAIVTGASKGIGAAIATYFAAEGAKVVVNYASSKDGADQVVNAITANGGVAIAVQGDVSREADVTRLFEETTAAFGPVDVLVNNAGIYQGSFGRLFPSAIQHQCMGVGAGHPSCGKTVRRPGWQHHQHQFRSQQIAASHRVGVLGHQSRIGCHYDFVVEGIQWPQHSHQLHPARGGGNGRVAQCRLYWERGRNAISSGHSFGAYRAASRYRESGRIPCLR